MPSPVAFCGAGAKHCAIFPQIVGIFDRLFGRGSRSADLPKVEVTISYSGPERRPPPVTTDDLSPLQIELLARLGRDPVSSFSGPWAGLDVRRELDRFRRLGHLQEASVARKMDACFWLTELKPLLKGRGLKQAGKKAELIERLLQSISPDEAKALVHGLKLYEFTPGGAALVEAQRKRIEESRLTAEAQMRSALEKRDVRTATDVLARYEASLPFHRGLGIDWSKGAPGDLAGHVAALLADALDDLDVPAEVKACVRVELALGELLGERPEGWGKRVLSVTGGTLPCSKLDAFLADPCGGYASSFEADDQEARAELWAHTHVFRASAQWQLEIGRAHV